MIRLLLKRYETMKNDFMGDKIGIDDFAYKKRHTYGTILVDEETHNPIQLLDIMAQLSRQKSKIFIMN